MLHKLETLNHNKHYQYFIITARLLLAYTFFHYGYLKLVGHQFGVHPEELNTPIKDLHTFRISWYLFNHQPFKIIIAISQIICAGLLLFRKTALWGALLFLPIISTILIIDISFMPSGMATTFAYRLSWYILLDLLIIASYWEHLKPMIISWYNEVRKPFPLSKWTILLIPIAMGLIEIVPKVLQNLMYFISLIF